MVALRFDFSGLLIYSAAVGAEINASSMLEEIQNYKSEREISFRALLTNGAPEVRFERVTL